MPLYHIWVKSKAIDRVQFLTVTSLVTIIELMQTLKKYVKIQWGSEKQISEQ